MKFKKDNISAFCSDNDREAPTDSNSSCSSSRRLFLKSAGMATLAMGLQQVVGCSEKLESDIKSSSNPAIQGFEEISDNPDTTKDWESVSDRKIRVGIVGGGFGRVFPFQDHPNAEVVAVSDLMPDRLTNLAKVNRVSKTYPSLKELLKDDNIEAVFLATDAPSHAQHTIDTLQHGKHVAVAVPAVFGSLEEAEKVLEAVGRSGLKYMMFETSYFREDFYAMRQIYKAGGFGKLVYSEGEYYHPPSPAERAILTTFSDWRVGLPPQWYPTHSNAYYIGVTGETFTHVSCLGMPSAESSYQPEKNKYNNSFASEIALFRTSEGGMSRMAVSWDTQGHGGEMGRVRGQKGSFVGKYEGLEQNLPDLRRPGLPPGLAAGGHGGSHGRLIDEFITAILQDRESMIDIATSLNLTVPGIIAHQSALRDGELINIPQFKL